MGTLDGKKALVTGGSRGIGRAVVERMVREGAEVVFSYREREEAAAEVVAAAEAAGGRAHAVRADLGSVDAVRGVVDEADRLLGGLDILVNNAAQTGRTLIDDVTEDEYDRMMAVNVKAVFFAVQEAARRMRDGGRIVNVSSVNTSLPAPGIALYTAGKGAVEQITAVAARELGARGITVNTVVPGATDTEMLRDNNSEESLAMAADMSPLGRLGRPSDVADVIVFLCGDDARWLTRQRIHAAGGIV